MKTKLNAVVSGLVILALVGCSGDSQAGKDEGSVDAQHASATATEQAEIGQPAPDFTLTDMSGIEHTLSDFNGKWVVLEWVNYDCPFVKAHYESDNIPELQKWVFAQGGIWLSICSSAPEKQGYFEGSTLISRVTAEGSHTGAYLIDSDGTVGRTYGAQTTPHMYVINPAGELVYMGAIDDKPATKVGDIGGSINYVRAALEAGMAGEKIEVQATKPYGCSVKY